MADGFRFPGAGNFYYPQHTQHHPRHVNRNGTPPNTVRAAFNNNDVPSPSRSPASNSPAQNLPYGMYGQGHNQAQHGRVNGGPNGRGMPQMMYQYQHQNSHQGQQPNQHHQNMQQDHNTHNPNGAILSHHQSYSSGVLSNATPNFTANSLPNGHSTTTRGGQAQQITEHWAEQLKLHKETERAHSQMVDQHQSTFFARKYASHNNTAEGSASPKNTAAKLANLSVEDEDEDRGRPANIDEVKRQDWHNMDLSGQGLRVLSAPIFGYHFLNQLYISSNKITQLPPDIGKLRQLRLLDASHNLLTELPPELGMCVYLKDLLLFDNQIQTLPNELGSLFKLEMLGIEGNPLDSTMKAEIMERGTKSLITLLREQAPGKQASFKYFYTNN